MSTIDDVRKEWDEHLTRTSKAVIEAMTMNRGTKEQLDKASGEQLEALLGYRKFKRVMKLAAEIEDERQDDISDSQGN